jgi:PRC-barrel domain
MLRKFKTLHGRGVIAFDGAIGSTQEFYFDDEHWTLRYLVVDTGSWLKDRPVLIGAEALGDLDGQPDAIAVRLTREQVCNSIPLDAKRPVSRQYETDRYRRDAWSPYRSVTGATGWGVLAPPNMFGAQPGAAGMRPHASLTDTHEGEDDPHLRSSAEIQSRYSILAEDGKIGRVHDFIINDDDWHLSYIVVRLGTLFFGRRVLIPTHWIARISFGRRGIYVNLARFAIKEAPAYSASTTITREFEQRVHDHYG